MSTHAVSAEAAPRRALFFGDSLVAGIGDPAGGGWVTRIAAACFAAGQPLSIYNLGVRRETSVEVAARWRAEATPRIPPTGDCRIVLSFGANDTTIEDGSVRVCPERSCEALGTILDEANSLGLPVLLVGPAPVDDPDQNPRIGALTESFAEVCRQRDVPFIAVLEPLEQSQVWMSEVAGADGAHPAAGGYETIAELLINGGLLSWLTAPH
ncbi:MAG: GDSL-type esterase/lipase family protein [Solirubrobacteraceae bacterium]